MLSLACSQLAREDGHVCKRIRKQVKQHIGNWGIFIMGMWRFLVQFLRIVFASLKLYQGTFFENLRVRLVT